MTWLCWAGWSTRMPEHWRPARIHGDGRRGRLLVSDGEQITFQIAWQRTFGLEVNGEKWLRRRLGSAGEGTRVRQGGGFMHAMAAEGGDEGRGVWHGWAGGSGLMVELAYNAAAEDAARVVREQVIPAMATAHSPRGERWAVFDAVFHVPEGFRLVEHRLHLGDMALHLVGEGGDRLMLRQVYPASLALGRRSLRKWLADWPFAFRRRLRMGAGEVSEPGEAREASKAGEGWAQRLDCRGVRSLRFPLGWAGRRQVLASAVVDASADRLAIAQRESRGAPDERMMSEVLAGMGPMAEMEGKR